MNDGVIPGRDIVCIEQASIRCECLKPARFVFLLRHTRGAHFGAGGGERGEVGFPVLRSLGDFDGGAVGGRPVRLVETEHVVGWGGDGGSGGVEGEEFGEAGGVGVGVLVAEVAVAPELCNRISVRLGEVRLGNGEI